MNTALEYSPGRWTFLALAGLMALTRFHHGGSETALPDASFAVFFLLGLYWRGRLPFLGLLALAAVVDLAAVGIGGVSAYCLTPAYGFLVLAYAVLSMAGRWAAGARDRRDGLMRLAAALPAAVLAAFLISSYSFYWLSGQVSGVGVLTYGMGIAPEFFDYLGAATLYCGLVLGTGYLIGRLKSGRRMAALAE